MHSHTYADAVCGLHSNSDPYADASPAADAQPNTHAHCSTDA
jgi:hypothetical protein